MKKTSITLILVWLTQILYSQEKNEFANGVIIKSSSKCENCFELIGEDGKSIFKNRYFNKIGKPCGNLFWATEEDSKAKGCVGLYNVNGTVVLEPLYLLAKNHKESDKRIDTCITDWIKLKRYVSTYISALHQEEVYVNNKGEISYYIPKKEYTGTDDYDVYYYYDYNTLKKNKGGSKLWNYVDRVSGKVTPIIVNGNHFTCEKAVLLDDNTIIVQYGTQSYASKEIIIKKNSGFEYLSHNGKIISYQKMISNQDDVLLENTKITGHLPDLYKYNSKNWELDTIYYSVELKNFDKQTGCWYVEKEVRNKLKNEINVMTPSLRFLNTSKVELVDESLVMYKQNDSLFFYDLKEDTIVDSYKLRMLSTNDCYYCPQILIYPVEGKQGKIDFVNKLTREHIIKNVEGDLASPFLMGAKFTKVKKNELYGAIDLTGKTVIRFSYGDMKYFAGNYVPVAKSDSNLWGIVNIKDSLVLSYQFQRIDAIKIGYEDAYFEGINLVKNEETISIIINGVISKTTTHDKYKNENSTSNEVQCPHCIGSGKAFELAGGKICWSCHGSGLTGKVDTEKEVFIFGNAVSTYARVHTKKSAQKCSYCYQGYIGKRKMEQVDCSLCGGNGKVKKTVRDKYLKEH